MSSLENLANPRCSGTQRFVNLSRTVVNRRWSVDFDVENMTEAALNEKSCLQIDKNWKTSSSSWDNCLAMIDKEFFSSPHISTKSLQFKSSKQNCEHDWFPNDLIHVWRCSTEVHVSSRVGMFMHATGTSRHFWQILWCAQSVIKILWIWNKETTRCWGVFLSFLRRLKHQKHSLCFAVV